MADKSITKKSFREKVAVGGKVAKTGTITSMGPQNRNQPSVSEREAMKRMFRGTVGHQ